MELATYEEEDFQINVARLEGLITERTKAIVINSPNNPTGTCLTTETMEEIARIAEKHDLLVISDEIYTAYSYQHPFIPFASLPGMAEPYAHPPAVGFASIDELLLHSGDEENV